MKTTLLWICLIWLLSVAAAFPLFDAFELDTEAPPLHIHHHHKHHIRHKHRRRSLSSKEDVKAQRNKQVMLTKPYWPWP